MSAMLKVRPRFHKSTRPDRPVEEREDETASSTQTLNPPNVRGEAPESALRRAEPPETRDNGRSEAPDAGEGRCETLEREFTHGRSRS
jgi:hypothetical protein